MKSLELFAALIILSCSGGCALAYKKKPRLAGQFGVGVIALSAISFALEGVVFALSKHGMERLILIGLSFLGATAVALYWFRIWQRKRPDVQNSANQ